MGTRADFYIGRTDEAIWLGSIAWDGYPDGIDQAVRKATTEESYRAALTAFFEPRDDVTLSDMGWPWPWDNSGTTDYAYAFDGGKVWGSCSGGAWFIATEEPEDHDEYDEAAEPDQFPTFPDMSARKNVRWDKGSGVIVVSAPGPERSSAPGDAA